MKANAIQQDATKGQEGTTETMPVEEFSTEGIPTPGDARMEAMERIEAARIAEMNNENGVVDNNEQVQTQSQEEQHIKTIESSDERKYTVKVDGEELEVTESDLIKGFQKNITASKRLQLAAEKQKELDAREAELAERERNPLTKGQAETESKESPASTKDDAVKDFLAALYEGNEENTAIKLRELLGRQEQAIPDVDALVGKVKNQLSADAAMEQFGKRYQDVVADPILSQVADGFLSEELNNGKTLVDALEEAGKQTREWVKSRAGVTETQNTPTNTSREARRERKEKMDTLTPVNIAAGGAAEPTEPSASDTIREMRKARGLAI